MPTSGTVCPRGWVKQVSQLPAKACEQPCASRGSVVEAHGRKKVHFQPRRIDTKEQKRLPELSILSTPHITQKSAALIRYTVVDAVDWGDLFLRMVDLYGTSSLV